MGMLPIRKVSDSRVALTSYYGKIFVDRCSRKVHNFGRWLSDQIRAIGLDDTDNRVINLVSGSVFYHDLQLPRIYSTLAKSFIEVSIKQATQEQTQPEYIRFYFDYAKRHKVLNLPTDNNIEIDGKLVCGVHSDGSYVVVDDAGIYKVSYSQITGYTYQELPSIQSMLGLEDKNIPIDFAEVMVFGVHVPVGIVLGYYLGLSNLVKSLTEPRIVPTGKRVNLQPNEWAMYFEDETWVFDASNKLASMILAGWRDYTRATIQYPAHEFDRKDVYLNILESKQYNSRYTREMDLMKQMFIDPITYRLLVKLKEPTTWVGLLKRSCELLLTDQHPAETDPRYTRIKGYERFAGIVYRELINGLRIHNSKGNKTRYKLDHNPYAVWAAITQDSSKEQVCETNPIQDLKEKEAVTYTGTGGRTARTMSKRTRVYHASELGTISESTVDSSDVGVNIFTSANPQFNCLEGLSDPFEPGKTGAASILSTSALASFGSDHDDAKRVLYAAVQNRHTIACPTYRQSPVRTGYEQIIPHRVSSTYAVTAKKSGKVSGVTADGITIVYDDGSTAGYPLGTQFGKAAGLIVPHTSITTLKQGDTFNIGQPITYNPDFFEPDILNPKQIVWKTAVTVTTALMENNDTLEDSSALSMDAAATMKTSVVNKRSLVVDFSNSIYRMVRPGDSLESGDILCVIDDTGIASSKSLDSEIISTLQALSNQTPLAKHKGVVSRIEVFYHGDKSDMSESLRQLADVSDRELAKRCRAQGKKVFTGSVDTEYRVNNDPLFLDQAVINVYITSEVIASIGDKTIFANQMKTVVGSIFSNDCQTESGVKIDAIFGAKSIDDRIVDSPILIGTTIPLLELIGKKFIEAYES